MTRHRLTELFEQAIELAPEECANWIEAACAGDDGLRAELERLLRADASAANFLEKPPALIADGFVDSAVAPESVRQFGPWRALRSIGIGGMGEVWLAERSDGDFEQRVAIKQLAYPTPGLLNRFRQERQILARLEHPNIARLIDGGVDAAGAPYLAMEYVEGVPITEFVRERALDLRARLILFLRVCDGVQYAHQNLVVHRDLKPANIFVTKEGMPKLLDFGIAKVLATTDEASATQTAARLLTPDYAAPEQFSGAPITTATDVYALGVVLYELLAGMRPKRTMQSGMDSSNSARITDRPPPSAALERATGPVLRRALRGDLDRITLTALAHEPSHRYPSAEALAADIRRYLHGRPISARGDAAWYRFRKFAGRNRFALAAAAAVVAISIAGALVSLHQARLARAQVQRAETVRAFLVGVFEQVDPDESKGQSITAEQLLEKGEAQLAGIDIAQAATRADLTALIGNLYWNIGEGERAQKLLPLLAIAATNPAIPDEIKVRCLNTMAHIESERRMFEPAVEHARRAIKLAQGGSEESPEASDARRILAHALAEQNDPAAEPLLRTLIASDKARYGERSGQVCSDLLLLGSALDGLSRREEAVVVLRRQVALARDLHGNLNSSVVNGLNALAGVLMRTGDLTGAASAYREALTTETAMLGADRAESVTIHSNLLGVMERQGEFSAVLKERLAMIAEERKRPVATRQDTFALTVHLAGYDYRELGRLAEAETSLREALAIWRKVQGSSDGIDSAPPLENLGVVLYLEGRYAEAEDALRQSAAIMRKRASPSSQWLARMRGELADVLRREHRYAEALREANEATAALSGVLKKSSERNPVLPILQAQLSEAQLDAGDAVAAQRTAVVALVAARSALPEKSYRLGTPLFALARTHLALEQATEAEPLLREALVVRCPPHPADDPRVLEVKVALVNALTAQHKNAEARALKAEVGLPLKASTSPYAAELLARLAAQ